MVKDIGAILAMLCGVGAKNSFLTSLGAGLLLRQDHLIGNVGAGELLARHGEATMLAPNLEQA